jgi:hypothetical protein
MNVTAPIEGSKFDYSLLTGSRWCHNADGSSGYSGDCNSYRAFPCDSL